MKIIYKDKDLKRICEEDIDLNIETILKKLESSLGKKILVLEYSEDIETHEKNVKVQNKIDESIKAINIRYDSRSSTDKFRTSSFSASHLVTIREMDNDEKDIYLYDKTFEVGRYVAASLSDNFYNLETGLLIHETMGINGKKNYTLVKDNKICKFYLPHQKETIIIYLLEFNELELKYIYDNLKKLNEDFVKNIRITLEDNENNKEELYISDNVFQRYEKTFIKDGSLITLNYEDGKINVTTKQEIPEKESIKTREVDVTEELQKVKKLFK